MNKPNNSLHVVLTLMHPHGTYLTKYKSNHKLRCVCNYISRSVLTQI